MFYPSHVRSNDNNRLLSSMLVEAFILFILNSSTPQRYNRLAFHLFCFLTQFITQAFRAVLRVRFPDLGLDKIDKGEFFIKETATNREIDLSQPWDQCFLPGQRADMSMVFRTTGGDRWFMIDEDKYCSACHWFCGCADRAEVVWSVCTHGDSRCLC